MMQVSYHSSGDDALKKLRSRAGEILKADARICSIEQKHELVLDRFGFVENRLGLLENELHKDPMVKIGMEDYHFKPKTRHKKTTKKKETNTKTKRK